ncbi:MAG: M1 family peptidase, partial [Flavobacteriaceae bacterium]|nr:M1 family peptidase [Flavobacteriaceae bacterium]
VGHNFFPMIINSDERQWSWMDEGLNSFVEYLTEELWDNKFPTRKGSASSIVDYMKLPKDQLEPIMSNSENIVGFGPNAYTKPATGLNILRETIMGRELFDYAFKEYARRWAFKHPEPADFFRTMEDASGEDLDWFWRGWFYTTDYNDIGIREVKQYYLTDQPTEKAKEFARKYNIDTNKENGLLYFATEQELGSLKNAKKVSEFKSIDEYISKLDKTDKTRIGEAPNYFYEVTFDKPGGLVLPLIVELTFADGTKERKQFPAEIWSKHDNEVKRVFATSKQITNIVVDPDQETADIDTSNNSWPQEKKENQFEKFKEKVKN